MYYTAPKGIRVNRYFTDVVCNDGYIYNSKLEIWEESPSDMDNWSCSYEGIKTVKSFRKYLKRISKYLPSGVRFTLRNKYYTETKNKTWSLDVVGTTR